MINFLDTITALVLHIFSYFLSDSIICLTCICLVIYVFGSLKKWLPF